MNNLFSVKDQVVVITGGTGVLDVYKRQVRIIVDKVKKMRMEKQVEYISFSMNICEQLVKLKMCIRDSLLPDADRKIKKAIKKATTMDKYLTAVNLSLIHIFSFVSFFFSTFITVFSVSLITCVLSFCGST